MTTNVSAGKNKDNSIHPVTHTDTMRSQKDTVSRRESAPFPRDVSTSPEEEIDEWDFAAIKAKYRKHTADGAPASPPEDCALPEYKFALSEKFRGPLAMTHADVKGTYSKLSTPLLTPLSPPTAAKAALRRCDVPEVLRLRTTAMSLAEGGSGVVWSTFAFRTATAAVVSGTLSAEEAEALIRPLQTEVCAFDLKTTKPFWCELATCYTQCENAPLAARAMVMAAKRGVFLKPTQVRQILRHAKTLRDVLLITNATLSHHNLRPGPYMLNRLTSFSNGSKEKDEIGLYLKATWGEDAGLVGRKDGRVKVV